jgi:hypothetical protein
MNKKKLYLLGAITTVCITLLIIILILLSKDPLKEKIKQNSIRDGQNTLTDSTAEAVKDEKPLVLYYLKNGYYNLKSKTAKLKLSKNKEENYKNFLKILLGNEDKKFIMPVPDGIRVKTLYYSESRKMVILDLEANAKLNFKQGTMAEIEFIYFFVNNLCFNFPQEIIKVKILISGNEIKTVNGHLDSINPFYKTDSHFTPR